MNFVYYDPNTGEIYQMGWMAQEFVDREVDAGKPILALDDSYIERDKWRVNLETKELEPIPTE